MTCFAFLLAPPPPPINVEYYGKESLYIDLEGGGGDLKLLWYILF